MVSPKEEKEGKEEEEEVTFSSSSSSSDYDDSEDEYKNEPWKKSSRSRTLRKRAVKIEKGDIATTCSTIRPKKRRKKQDFGNTDTSTDPYSTNTFIYFENINSLVVEEADVELKKTIKEKECVGKDNGEVKLFPQNENSERSTEKLLTALLEKRSENITENIAQITHLPCNPFSERIAGFRSVNTISGRCQNIIQTYHPDIFKCEKPVATEGVPSFVIWNQPFEYLIHQKNVLDVNKNVKNIVQRKVDEHLDIRKQYLMNEIIEKANDILKRDMSTSNQTFPTYCGPEHLNYYGCEREEDEYINNDGAEAGVQETNQNAEIEDDEQYSDPFHSKPLFEDLKPKEEEEDLDISPFSGQSVAAHIVTQKMHPPQKAKCMNQECRKRCTMKRGPAFLECNHFFCTQCYNEPGFDRSCRLCSPQIVQPKTSKSNIKKLVSRKILESTEKVHHYVQQLETLEEEDDTAREEESKIPSEDVFTVDHEEFVEGNTITEVENDFNNTKDIEILDNSELEKHNKEDIIDEKEKRAKIKKLDSQIKELANLDLNIPSDYVMYTDLRVKNLRIMEVRKYLRKSEPSNFLERYKKIEQFGDSLNAMKDKCEEGVRNLAGTFINSISMLAEEFKTNLEVDVEERDVEETDVEETDVTNSKVDKQWRLDNFVTKMTAFPEPLEEFEDVNKEYHKKKEVTKNLDSITFTKPFKTPTRSKLLGPTNGGEKSNVQTPIIKKPISKNQSAVTQNDAFEMLIMVPKKDKLTQKTWRDELYTKNDPQPQSELEKHMFEVNWCLSQKYKKVLSSKSKEESLVIIGTLIGNMTIYENCRQSAIETFENTFNVKLPIIQTVQ